MTNMQVDHRSTASVSGHPVHPALVPIPIGLLTAAAASDVAHLVTGDRFFARASRWLLAGGFAGGATAAVPGLIDFVTIRAARGPVGIAHAAGNATILGITAASLLMRRESADRVPFGAMALSLLAALLLAGTGWLGGELVVRERIGVVPLAER